ncbi:helix-turn-helix domain-containing protein [Paenibacillus massiliensis]|uniref:helix-turn-helix domain-containing protein n=1 Tax=Paenibacillus massiliensis TaxID=225917 RepID=UPI00036DC4F5|nr:AraC family transcriptional regulator [Paenibacillus massiliensis]
MIFYGAEHHILVLSDTIDADVHKHSFIQVTIALEAPFDMDIEGEPICSSGVIINSNVTHRLHGMGQPLLLLLMDSTSTMAASFKHYMGSQPYALFPAEIIVDAVAPFVQNTSPHVKDTDGYVSFLEKLMQHLHLDYMQPAMTDPRIKKLIQLIKACTDSDHSIGHFASQIGLSNSRLSHLFKENTGISLSGYILLHKLQKASYLIFQGLRITDAAMAAGFDSPSHLAATSKKLLGMTAKDIRKDSVFLQVSCLH